MKKIDYSSVIKILIIRPCKIGDIVISSFVFSAIKKFNPNIILELITLTKNREVLKFNPYLDKIYFISQNIFSLFRLLPLRRNNYDLIIDLNDNPSRTSAILLKILRSTIKLGFNFPKQKKFLTIAIPQPPKDKTHLIERYAYLLRESGLIIDDKDVKPEIYLDSKLDNSLKNQFSEIKKNYKLVGINISAGAPIRKLSPERWIVIINGLKNIYDKIKIVLIYEPNDFESANIIKTQVGNEIIIDNGKNTFQKFACTIKHLDLLITPDTSAVHIASALNIPVIALYPNVRWNFISFAPYKTKSISILSPEEKIDFIKTDDIINAYKNFINELNW